jgi:hypothetical protein
MKNVLIFCFAGLFLLACGGGSDRKRGAPSPADSSVPVETVKPVINVYIENSKSMDGYVNGATEFKTSISLYLSDIKGKELTDTLNLLYINSEIINPKQDIIDFIQKLNPASFAASVKKKDGTRGISDISNVIKSVLDKTQQNVISILVTDGIFSLEKSIDASQHQIYLTNQQIGIRDNMQKHLKKYPGTAVIVYQLLSKFDGTYYDKVNKHIPFKGQRPFYIWIIGDAKHVDKLRTKIPAENINIEGGGVQNVFSIVAGNQNVKYAVHNNSGEFDLSKTDPKKEIWKLKKDSRSGKVTFAVNVDFSELLLDDSYLTNPANYENSSGYQLEITRSRGNTNYTHFLNFISERVHKGQVAVKLKSTVPDWVSKANDDEGSTPVENKTYGIKYLIEGVFKAFTSNNEYYAEIKIDIK